MSLKGEAVISGYRGLMQYALCDNYDKLFNNTRSVE